jgi:hypothetical protein
MAISFFCDVNVQKLAKWLRFAGFDTITRKELSLTKIDSFCQKKRLVFITRSKKKEIKYFRASVEILDSECVYTQLDYILSKYPIDKEKTASRCIKCNVLLRVTPSDDNEKKYCPRCGRYYWQGTHYQNMIAKLLDNRT